ncbi:MAG: polysaccharide biosynthesis C-terminal domain-containing protein [Lachnotalea sp.]
MMNQSKKNSFVKQAGILAFAGIIVRMIGILYRRPLTQLIGKEGIGYYSTAYNIYAIILLVSSYSIPAAISKEIAKKLIANEYKNAQRIFYCAIIYVILVGGVASLFTFFGASVLVENNSIIVLRAFAPTVFLSGILGVFRGYFQAHRTMIQTSISQILEQIFNAVVSVAAAYYMMRRLALADATTQRIYGAMGSAIGTGAGVLFALLFMLMIYLLHQGSIQKRMQEDLNSQIQPYPEIFKIIFHMVTPIILSTFIYSLSTSLNQTIYIKILKYVKGLLEKDIIAQYGVFAGEVVIIVNIPIALAAAMSAALLPSISGSFFLGHKKETNHKVDMAIRTTMLIAIPAAVGFAVLARPVVQTLFPQKDTLMQAASLLRCLSITVIFYSLSTITNGVLQGIGKVNIPVVNALISLSIQTVVLVVTLLTTDWNLYALTLVMIVYSFLMCILNGISVYKYLGYRINMKKTFVIPIASSIVMGAVAYFSYRMSYTVCGINSISLLISIVLAASSYFILVIKVGGISENEMKALPQGEKLAFWAKKMRVLS